MVQDEKKVLVGFNDLTMSLKVLVVLGWINVALLVLAFVIGFIEGVMGV